MQHSSFSLAKKRKNGVFLGARFLLLCMIYLQNTALITHSLIWLSNECAVVHSHTDLLLIGSN